MTISGTSGISQTSTKAQLIACSGVPVALTGTGSETALASIRIPPMGPNDALRIQTLWSFTNSVNTKTLQVKLSATSGITGTAFHNTGHTTTALMQAPNTIIQNANSTSSQVGFAATSNLFGVGATSTAQTTATIQTNAGSFINLTGILANTGETITLLRYSVELLRA